MGGIVAEETSQMAKSPVLVVEYVKERAGSLTVKSSGWDIADGEKQGYVSFGELRL